MYIICTTRVQHPSHMGWAPHIMGPTHVREVLYTCCTCGVRESPLNLILRNAWLYTLIPLLSHPYYYCLKNDRFTTSPQQLHNTSSHGGETLCVGSTPM
jgi:hypothetical protein